LGSKENIEKLLTFAEGERGPNDGIVTKSSIRPSRKTSRIHTRRGYEALKREKRVWTEEKELYKKEITRNNVTT